HGLEQLPCAGEGGAEDGFNFVELGLADGQRRRELDDGVAAVVGAAVQAVGKELLRQEVLQDPLRLIRGKRLLGGLVLDQLNAVEVPGAADIAHNGQVQQ